MRNLNNKQSSLNPLDVELPPNGMGLPHPGQWSDDESEIATPKRMRLCDQGYASDHTAITDYGEKEPRMWTQQHMEAAAAIQQPAMLTPPSMVCAFLR